MDLFEFSWEEEGSIDLHYNVNQEIVLSFLNFSFC